MKSLKQNNISNLLFPTYVFFITFVAWTAYSPLGSVFYKEFGLNLGELGLLLSLPKLMALPTRYLAGYLSDKIGAKYTLMLISGISSFAVGLTGFSTTLIQLYAAAALLGIAGSTFPAGIAYVGRKYAKFKGTYLGIYGGIGNFGSAISGIIVPLLYLNYGFKFTFIILALLVLTSLFLMIFAEKDIFQKSISGFPNIALIFFGIALGFLCVITLVKLELFELLLAELVLISVAFISIFLSTERKTFYISYLYFVSFGGFLAVGLWVPSIFSIVFHLKLLSSGIILLSYGATTLIFRPLGGILGDLINSKKSAIISFSLIILSALLFSMFLFTKNLYLSILSVILLGSTLSLANGSVFKIVSEKYNNSNIGNSSGIIGGLAGFGGFAITALLGYVDIIAFYFSPILLALLSILALGVIKNER